MTSGTSHDCMEEWIVDDMCFIMVKELIINILFYLCACACVVQSFRLV